MQNSGSPRCPILVIEGIDGSGKGTQARFVTESLTAAGHRCLLLSFPRYEQTFFGQRIGDFLNGNFGTLEELNPFLVSLLYAGDRFESLEAIRQGQQESELLILDRYVPSNIAHQSAKCTKGQRQQLAQWIEHIEYNIFSIPKPSEIVLLDIPVELSQMLISRKSARSYTAQSADLQEADVCYLAQVREVYLELAATKPNWNVVPVANAHGLRPPEVIGQDVLNIARSLIKKNSLAIQNSP